MAFGENLFSGLLPSANKMISVELYFIVQMIRWNAVG